MIIAGTHNRWPIYDTLTADLREASDRAAVWARTRPVEASTHRSPYEGR
jgi:hypothetical protein